MHQNDDDSPLTKRPSEKPVISLRLTVSRAGLVILLQVAVPILIAALHRTVV